MFNLQGSEIIIILLLALVVLGPEKLPDAIRKFSQTYGEIKKMGNGFQSELKSALDEPMREMRETADMVQRAADPKRIAEEAENEARLKAEADAAAQHAADKPVDPAAYEVSDPAATAAATTAAATTAAPLVAKPANGTSVKKVNQIALSMARGPIDPATDEATPAPAEAPQPLTAPPSGAASMLAPPPVDAVAKDVPPPPNLSPSGDDHVQGAL